MEHVVQTRSLVGVGIANSYSFAEHSVKLVHARLVVAVYSADKYWSWSQRVAGVGMLLGTIITTELRMYVEQARSDVGVGAVSSTRSAGHTVKLAHSRSESMVGFFFSYS